MIEEHQSGYPHYHLIVRSQYLPQQVVKKEWQALTGAQIVDIREVKQFFNSFQYLVKYLTKLHRVQWTDRHVTYSKGFFPVPITDDPGADEWKTLQSTSVHPLEYIRLEYDGRMLNQLAPLTFELPGRPGYFVAPHPEEKPRPIVQRDLDF